MAFFCHGCCTSFLSKQGLNKHLASYPGCKVVIHRFESQEGNAPPPEEVVLEPTALSPHAGAYSPGFDGGTYAAYAAEDEPESPPSPGAQKRKYLEV